MYSRLHFGFLLIYQLHRFAGVSEYGLIFISFC